MAPETRADTKHPLLRKLVEANALLSNSGLQYRELMRVLASIFEAVRDSDQTKLAARFRKLQAAGLPSGKRPGRGEKTGYNIAQICEIAICLSMSDFGLEPRHLERIVRNAPPVTFGSMVVEYADLNTIKTFPSFVLDLYNILIMRHIVDVNYGNTYFIFFPNIITQSWDPEKQLLPYKMVGDEDDFSALGAESRFAVINFAFLAQRIWDGIKDGLHPKA